MIYAVYVALALVAFLLVLNEFLKGAKKAQIDTVLTLLLIGLIIIAFFIAGWKLGLLAIAIAFISAVVTRPIAAQLASRIFAASSDDRSRYVGLPPRPLQRISQELGKPLDPNKLHEEILESYLRKRFKKPGSARLGVDRQASAENALFDYCEQQPPIQALLREFKIPRQVLRELYDDLIRAGAGQWRCGHWIPASALAYPESLRYLLTRRKENRQETAFNLIMYF